MELVSVIIPVYNVEKYLRDCIDSVLRSDYSNLQVILINDGSTDSSRQICDEYAEIDRRVKVIHQENRGLIAARNAGLEVATGKYVAFVDSDDIISPYLYTVLVSAIENDDADMVCCEFVKKAEDLQDDMPAGYSLNRFDNYDDQLALFTCAPSVRNISWTAMYVWDKLYRRDRIKQTFRKECLMCEDLAFNYDFVQCNVKVSVVPKELYYYRVHPNSIMGTYHKKRGNVENAIANALLWCTLADDVKIKDPMLKDYLKARAVYVCHSSLLRIILAHQEKEQHSFMENAMTRMRKNCRILFCDKETYSMKIKMAGWLCAHVFFLWKLLVKIGGGRVTE